MEQVQRQYNVCVCYSYLSCSLSCQSKLKSKQMCSFKVPLRGMTDVPLCLLPVEYEHLVLLPPKKEGKKKERNNSLFVLHWYHSHSGSFPILRYSYWWPCLSSLARLWFSGKSPCLLILTSPCICPPLYTDCMNLLYLSCHWMFTLGGRWSGTSYT